MSESNSKKSTHLYGINLTKEFGEKGAFFAILVSEDKPLANEKITMDLIINNEHFEYYRVTDEIGSINLPINLAVGEYPIETIFKGSDDYESCSTKNLIIVTAPPHLEIEEKKDDNKIDEQEWDELSNNEIEKEDDLVADFKVYDDVMIQVENVTMEFDLAKERVDNLKEYVIKGIKGELEPKTKFTALDDVSFTVHKGERLGVIGFNGAGKSTLLKILSRVMKATKGSMQLAGNVAPLLELGAGFDHNYTGAENIFLNGAILGYKKEFLEKKYDEIVEFSELGEFINVPIKNYSSGMIAKLGFSIATIVEPDILILDEVLSVGDVKFQNKSGKKLKSLMKAGVTVVLVSHSVSTVRKLCNKAIWLDKGKLLMYGDVNDVCDAYVKAAAKASAPEVQNLELD